ncbi:hypothetical protein EVA_06817, partial [gut metagenome]
MLTVIILSLSGNEVFVELPNIVK